MSEEPVERDGGKRPYSEESLKKYAIDMISCESVARAALRGEIDHHEALCHIIELSAYACFEHGCPTCVGIAPAREFKPIPVAVHATGPCVNKPEAKT